MQINLFPDLSLFAVLAIFIVNYFVVSHFLIRPINGVLEARETEVRAAHETYERSLADFNKKTAEIEERFHVARREASQLRERFRTEAATLRAKLIERTSADAKGLVTDADERLRRDVDEARQKIVRESESLARLAAERILGRAV
jgi:F-type H+-transporting ATPase subunit b